MGNFGDPSNFEWRQYVIPDDDSDLYRTCPFQPRADAQTEGRNRIRAREDDIGMHDTEFDLPELPDAENANAIVKAFATNTAYRAAQQHELTTESNPFRRPVRPDDLAWLDYSAPMPAHDALKLSGLLGNRMLRNIYDTNWRASHIPDSGPNKVRPGMEGDECQNGAESTRLNSRTKQRRWWSRPHVQSPR